MTAYVPTDPIHFRMTQPTPSVRLKDDQIILKLGSESCVLTVTDGVTDDAAHLAKTIQIRIQEVLQKRARKLQEKIRDAG